VKPGKGISFYRHPNNTQEGGLASMARFDSTLSKDIKRAARTTTNAPPGHLNTHQQRGIEALSIYHERKEK